MGEGLNALRTKHASIPGYGAGGARFFPLVSAFAREIAARSALDYACGKGNLADKLMSEGVVPLVHKYEMGVPAFSNPCPEMVDLVICNHALYEFRPADFVASVVYLRAISRLGAFITFQWGESLNKGLSHWEGPMQDADWVYSTLRQHWPCHRMIDSGPNESKYRQFVFYGFTKVKDFL